MKHESDLTISYTKIGDYPLILDGGAAFVYTSNTIDCLKQEGSQTSYVQRCPCAQNPLCGSRDIIS